jgi:hypothetical protein
MNRNFAKCAGLGAALALTALVWPGTATRAGNHPAYSALAGLDVARDAARTWSTDARLVYLENDEPVADDGTAVRWGYLFQSASRGKARGYSVRDGKILEAFDLGFDLDAPAACPPLDAARPHGAAQIRDRRDQRHGPGGRRRGRHRNPL